MAHAGRPGAAGAASQACRPDDRVVVCGVGCGGPMSPDGETVSPLNIAGWRDFPLRARLHELTGVPTFVDNDAKALALARGLDRRRRRAARLHRHGGVDRRRGRRGARRPTARGSAGQRRAHRSRGRRARRSRLCLRRARLPRGRGVRHRAGRHHRPAGRVAPPDVVERTGTLVGRAVASVVNLLDLPLAVVSGSVALGFGEPFFAAAQREMELRCGLEFARGAQVVPGGARGRGPADRGRPCRVAGTGRRPS